MKIYKLNFLLLFMLFLSASPVKAQNASELLKKMDDLISMPKDKEAIVKIVLTDKSGKEKVREALMKQKGRYMKLYRYTKPEKQAGISTLSLPGDVIWLYMPAFGKPMKISLLSRSQAFTGTDFSYEDMSGSSYSDRYTPKLLKSDNPKTYLLELTPKSTKSKYSKIDLYLNKEYYYPVKMEYYDTSKKKMKVASYTYAKRGKYWYAEKVLMYDLKKNHSTKIMMTNLKFDQGLKDDYFTVENLKNKN